MKLTGRDLAAAMAAAALVQAAMPAWADDAPAAPSAAASAVVPARIVASSNPGRGDACRPAYPPDAVRKNVQGITRLRFYVDATGKPTAVSFLEHSGPTAEHRLLDTAAAKALIQCPFEAGRDASGQPVASSVDVSYTWKLE